MDERTVSIVMTGHLDHGKSTLIGRLLLDTHSLPNGRLHEIREAARELEKETELAFLVDQLKEERQQERSIETTQVNLRTQKRSFLLIDAPGHPELIANMLTGASSADAAILIVDASDGIKQQTRRHVYLIKLLGIQKVIIVLNKMDLVKYRKERFEIIRARLAEYLEDLSMTPLAVIPISAKKGDNVSRPSTRMRWYTGPSLLQALCRLSLDKNKQRRPLRFCVQDVYQLKKEKVVVGKVLSGVVREGQPVLILPLLKKTKVTLIKFFGLRRKRAGVGENIGLCLRDSMGIKRGHIITAEHDFPKPLHSFKSYVFWISQEPLRVNQTFFVRLLTQEFECTAKIIENPVDSETLKMAKGRTSKIKSNQVAKITLETKKPIIVEDFSFIDELGRFVIERKNRLQGIGVVSNS